MPLTPDDVANAERYYPAFPTINFSESGYPYTDSPGMSLRDWFAGQALAGLAGRETSAKQDAEDAYHIADAMIAKRSEK